jgi:hypothetical protein
MAVAPLLVTAAASATKGVNPYFVGAGIMVLVILTMLGLLAFGAGRDHS